MTTAPSYRKTLDYLFSQLPMYQRVGKTAFKKDLSNTLALCEHLGNPHRKLCAIHIAGTHGKGSVAHMLASVLQSAGYRTGLYTSPHLKDFRERIKLNGRPIPEQRVIQFVEANKPIFERIRPSFFEMTVAMAFDYFVQERVDIAVIETGLGGRLDSTNVLTPLLSLITNIGMEHTQYLGNTLPDIAREKGGIIKEGVPVVIGTSQAETEPVFRKMARHLQAPLTFADRAYPVYNVQINNTGLTFARNNSTEDSMTWEVDLGGLYEQYNLPAVFAAIHVLQAQHHFEIPEDALRQGLRFVKKQTGFRGRWDVLSTDPLTICDCAHNEASIKLIFRQLEYANYNKIHVVLGMVNDKDPAAILSAIPPGNAYYYCAPSVPRALPAPVLQKEGLKFSLEGGVYYSVNQALRSALSSAGKSDVVLITGSTFVVAEVV